MPTNYRDHERVTELLRRIECTHICAYWDDVLHLASSIYAESGDQTADSRPLRLETFIVDKLGPPSSGYDYLLKLGVKFVTVGSYILFYTIILTPRGQYHPEPVSLPMYVCLVFLCQLT